MFPAGSTLVIGEFAVLLGIPEVAVDKLPPEYLSGTDPERRCPGFEFLLSIAQGTGSLAPRKNSPERERRAARARSDLFASEAGFADTEPEELELLVVAPGHVRKGETGELMSNKPLESGLLVSKLIAERKRSERESPAADAGSPHCFWDSAARASK